MPGADPWGTVCYHTAKILAVDDFQQNFRPTDPCQPHDTLLLTRLEDLAQQISAVNATWVRAAHHVPPRSFHRQMLASGIQLIQTALDLFLANRARVTRPSDDDLVAWYRGVSASWLASQIQESRILSLNGQALCATLPWDFSVDLGIPMVLEGFGNGLDSTAPDTRQAVAAAYAPLAVYTRTLALDQPLEVFVLNNGEAVTGTVVMEVDGVEVWSQVLAVDGQSVASVVVPAIAPTLTDYHDRMADVYFDDGQAPSFAYRFFIP